MPRKVKSVEPTTSAPKTTKSKKVSKSKTVAAAPVVAAPVVAAPVVVAPVVVAPVVATPVVATPVVEETAPTLNDEFSELLTQFTTMRTQMTALASRVRTLQKRCDRELRVAQKASRRRVKKSGNRAPSGFVKPTEISLELATFLGKPKGTEMARTEVTREINQYIREHKLQDPANGRRILPDTKLRKLLRVPTEDELTYFNLQRYMSPHFTKSKAALALVAAAAAAAAAAAGTTATAVVASA